MSQDYPDFPPLDATAAASLRQPAVFNSHGRPLPPLYGFAGFFTRHHNPILLLTAILTTFAAFLPEDAAGQFPPPRPIPFTPPVAAAPGPASTGFDRRESVLDRMKEFKGQKTREAMAALFVRFDPAFSQEPAILLSDGTATARVTLRVPPRKGETPKFSISGGHCVSAKAADNGLWILEILPNRGSMATSVTVLSGGSMTEYPLTVAPPLNLLDPRKAEIVEIEYAVLANELTTAASSPARR